MKSKSEKAKKPFYKKWWVWAIVGVVGLGAVFGGGSGEDKPDNSADQIAQVQPAEENNQQPEHIHSWIDATCTEPKTCTSCGDTEGEALGHSWREATCTEPKTCTRCGVSEGDPLGHDMLPATAEAPSTCSRCGYVEGEPLTPTENPVSNNDQDPGQQTPSNSDSNERMVWIPTNGGTKYHSNQYCSDMENPIQVTEEDAIAQGFTACKKCYG